MMQPPNNDNDIIVAHNNAADDDDKTTTTTTTTTNDVSPAVSCLMATSAPNGDTLITVQQLHHDNNDNKSTTSKIDNKDDETLVTLQNANDDKTIIVQDSTTPTAATTTNTSNNNHGHHHHHHDGTTTKVSWNITIDDQKNDKENDKESDDDDDLYDEGTNYSSSCSMNSRPSIEELLNGHLTEDEMMMRRNRQDSTLDLGTYSVNDEKKSGENNSNGDENDVSTTTTNLGRINEMSQQQQQQQAQENTLILPAPGNPVTSITLPSEMFNHVPMFDVRTSTETATTNTHNHHDESKRKRLKRKMSHSARQLRHSPRKSIEHSISRTKKAKKYVQEFLRESSPTKRFSITTESELESAKKLIIDLVYALLCFGMPVYLVEYHVSLISTCYGVGCEIDFTGNGFYISFTTGLVNVGHDTRVIKVKSSVWDLHKQTLLDDLATNIATGKVPLVESEQRIKDIIAQKPIYSLPIHTILIYLLSSSVLATLAGCLWQEIIGTLIASFFVALIVMKMPLYAPSLAPITQLVCTIASSIISVICRAIFAKFELPFQTVSTAMYAIFMLLPGLTFTIAISEFSRRHIRPGLIRLLLGLISGLQIGVALIICQIVESSFNMTNFTRISEVYPWWLSVLIIPLGGVAFAMGLKVPHEPLTIIFIVIDCYVTYYLTLYIGSLSAVPELGSFVGAFVARIVAIIFGWMSNRHPTIITCCVLLYQVRGSLFVKAVIALAHDDVNNGISLIVQVLIHAIGVGLGLFIADLLPIRHRHKNIGWLMQAKRILGLC